MILRERAGDEGGPEGERKVKTSCLWFCWDSKSIMTVTNLKWRMHVSPLTTRNVRLVVGWGPRSLGLTCHMSPKF